MRRMMHATFLIPGAGHYIELAHPFSRFAACGVTRVWAGLYDKEGRELAAVTLPLQEMVMDLATVFPALDDVALVLTDMTYDMKGKKHPYQYGFLYQNIAGATPIHYPLGPAVGLTDAINYSPNYGYFPLGPLPPWLGIRLYLGNVSEFGAIEPEVTVVTRLGTKRVTVFLPPLAHRMVDLPDGDGGEPIEYFTARCDAKPICYVAGVDKRTGALTFFEHLMQTFKLDGDENSQ